MNGRRAFTLIELLVATAVLGMLVAILVGVVERSASVTGRAMKHLDSVQEAESVFQRIATDLGGAVMGDGGVILAGANGSESGRDDAICLAVVQRPASTRETSRFQVVGYGMTRHDGATSLHRDMVGIPLNRSGAALIEDALASASTRIGRGDNPAGNRELLSECILRMAIFVEDAGGNLRGLAQSPTLPDFRSTPRLANGWIALDPSVARSLKIVLVVVDSASLSAFGSQVEALAVALPSVPSTAASPAGFWNRALTDGTLDGFPRALRSNIRIVERSFPLLQ